MSRRSELQLTRRDFLRFLARATAGSMLLGGAVYIADRQIEPDQLEIVRVKIPIPGLPKAFEGYRIVNLTDLHFGPAFAYHTVKRAVHLTSVLAPNLIVMTGDFITYWVNEAQLLGIFGALRAPDGVWAVMGNHDYWADIEGVRRALRKGSVSELQNSNVPLKRGEQTLWLAGVDDIWEQKHDLASALEGIPPDGVTILLAHEPDYADEVAPTQRVHLQLSGHSHGGQVRVPVIDKPVLSEFVHLARKYPHGLYQVGKMWLYTSAGLGRSAVPRAYAAPELTEITLTRAAVRHGFTPG